ncbi:hypothetical protein PG993_009839 [Apiospora rasikravindrae]|uniref:Uncharacterized protein n=1 Tax=Apiospora rasikravindrae TaxID=990691 RepID=A0ABR1SKJ2_9PEZI
MFGVTVKRAALRAFISRPVANKPPLPPGSHTRLNRILPPSRCKFHTRQAHGSNAKRRSGTLMAATGTTVVVALAASPMDGNVPRGHVHEIHQAWKSAFTTDSIVAARAATLLETRLWLHHYFRGDFIDEGTFDRPLLISRGVHILPEDTRVFYLPAENSATIPVVCVSLNHNMEHNPKLNISRAELKTLLDGELRMGELAKFHPMLRFVAVVAHLDQRVLSKWVQEGRFERCCVILRWADVTAPMVYENGRLPGVQWDDFLSDNGIPMSY